MSKLIALGDKIKSPKNKLQFNARVVIAFTENVAVLEITPQDWRGGVFLSRFYATWESSEKADVEMAAVGPVSMDELDSPSTVWVDITPSTRRGKRTLESVTSRPLPKKLKGGLRSDGDYSHGTNILPKRS